MGGGGEIFVLAHKAQTYLRAEGSEHFRFTFCAEGAEKIRHFTPKAPIVFLFRTEGAEKNLRKRCRAFCIDILRRRRGDKNKTSGAEGAGENFDKAKSSQATGPPRAKASQAKFCAEGAGETKMNMWRRRRQRKF